MIPMTPDETSRLLEQTERTVRLQKEALEAARRASVPMMEFDAKLKRLAEDARCSNELIGIAVRNHFSAFGGVGPAGVTDPEPGRVGSPPGTEAEKLLPPAVPQGLTSFCGGDRHDACPGAYHEHGNGPFVVCPCVCHSGIPEPLLVTARREPFSAESLDALAAWNLCCCCGTITAQSKWTDWHRPLEEEETPGAFNEWVPARPGEGDPMSLCPTCSWEHIDLDDGCSGYYSGTWKEMRTERAKDLPNYGEWWTNRLEEITKGEA